MASYKDVIEPSRKALKKSNIIGEKAYELCNNLLGALKNEYEYANEDEKKDYCYVAIDEIKPKIEIELKRKDIDPDLFYRFYNLYEELFYFAGRKSFKFYLLSSEFNKIKKVWENRIDLFEPVIHFLELMAFDHEMIELLRISFPPGYGKSYVLTHWNAWLYGQSIEKSVMRISCSDILVQQFGRDLQEIIRSETFCKAFPYFSTDRFLKKTADEFQFKESTERNYLCITRNSNIVGFRTDILIEDDLIAGTPEARNDDLHKSIIQKHQTDWTSRFKDEMGQTISIGTMFSPNDLLNWLYDTAERDSKRIYDIPYSDHEFVKCFVNKKGRLEIFITVPALDSNDKSTLEKIFSTTYFKKKRDDLLSDNSGVGLYEWKAVYQQEPISPTGLNFSYDNLQVYEDTPKDENGKSLISPYNLAIIDPARKGNDYIAMPILNPVGNKFYLVGGLFRQNAMSEVIDDVVDMLVKYKVRKLFVEINVDASLPLLLKNKFNERKWTCDIEEIYTTMQKEQKIKDNQGHIKNYIVFPHKNLLRGNSDLRGAMEQLTSYSFDKPNKHDDMPDALAMFIMNNMPEPEYFNEVEILNRGILGF